MHRSRAAIHACGVLAALFLLAGAAQGFIERLTPLKDILADSDYIALARVESVDPARPAAVLSVTTDYKGKASYKRLAINLTGDKEKHTPELLKRIAPGLPVVVFVTELDNKQLGLVYTNGTWFQIIGQADGANVRWAFTHCEIYLRRTFKGTTAELQQVVQDALANKKAPPPPNPKEPAGFGPVVESKPAGTGSLLPGSSPRPGTPLEANQHDAGWQRSGETLFGVIALPFLMPIAALLQLLFPGLLRDQWRQYKTAVTSLLSQSTVIFLHWIIVTWIVTTNRPGWLSDEALWMAVVGVAGIGALAATLQRFRGPRDALTLTAPVRVEYIALGVMLFAGLAWAGWQRWSGERPFADQMAVVSMAASAGLAHLLYRRLRASHGTARAYLTTEMVFLWVLFAGGVALGVYLNQPESANQQGHAVASEWATSRGNIQRTGSLKPDDPGPMRPAILWTFDPAERKGRTIIHSSPTVADNQVYVGALHSVATLQLGYVYCINASTGQATSATPLKAGQRIWRFGNNGNLRPVFCSPTIAGGKVYIGEGYHEDSACKLFCLDAGNGDIVHWSKLTRSHVESSPTVIGDRVFFGAGDDGLLCVDASRLETGEGGTLSPTTVWQVTGLHVDVSPLVVDGRVFAGSTLGDVHQELWVLAVDAETGKVLWRVPSELRITGSPSSTEGRVFFGLGNGKIGKDADQPKGAVWCLDAATGQRLWEYPTGNSVMSTPVLIDGLVHVTCSDGFCYTLRQDNGQLVWKQGLGAPLIAAPVAAGGRVYVLASTGLLACYAAADGRELWRFEPLVEHNPNQDAYASPTLVDGRLYVALGGKVFCIGDPPEPSNP